MTDLDTALRNDGAWRSLVEARLAQLRSFLAWAAACESGDTETSLRFRNRPDVERCRSVLPLFDEAWWGVVVYSCFDSAVGAKTAAERFSSRLPPTEAKRLVEAIYWPRGTVGGHRTQSGNRGAKASLVSVCDKAHELQDVLCAKGMTFEERFDELGRINVTWWGRTTRFDVLTRAGQLRVAGETYEPALAHLAGATGPKKGFEKIWGINFTPGNAERCEALLRKWSECWDEVADLADVQWPGEAYQPADFENALCVFQERPHSNLPDPADFR